MLLLTKRVEMKCERLELEGRRGRREDGRDVDRWTGLAREERLMWRGSRGTTANSMFCPSHESLGTPRSVWSTSFLLLLSFILLSHHLPPSPSFQTDPVHGGRRAFEGVRGRTDSRSTSSTSFEEARNPQRASSYWSLWPDQTWWNRSQAQEQNRRYLRQNRCGEDSFSLFLPVLFVFWFFLFVLSF